MTQAQELMRHVGKVLRTQSDPFTHELLPERWTDLIHQLADKERHRPRDRQCPSDSSPDRPRTN